MAKKQPLPLMGATDTRTSGIEAPNITPVYSGMESLGATILDTAYDNFAPAIYRGAQNILESVDSSSPIISAQELKTRYPDLAEKFTVPMREKAAQTIAERQRFRNVLKDVASNGPDTAIHKTAQLGVGLLTGFTDPIAIATGAGVAAGIARAGKSVTSISNFIGKGAQASAFGRMRTAGVEGFIGAAAEQPFVVAAASLDKSDYGIEDAAINLAAAPLFGMAISGSASVIKKAFSGPKSITTEHMNLLKTQEKMGVVSSTKHLDDFKSARVSNPDFSYSKFDPVNEFNTRTFYIPASKAGPSMKDGAMAKVFDDFGDGIYMTDDLVVANKSSHSGEVHSNGGVYEARFTEQPSVLDLDSKPVSDDIQLLTEAGIKNAETKTIKQSLQELMDLDSKKVDILKEKLAERYDVAMHSGGESPSGNYSNANTMIVLRPDKLETSYKGETDLNSVSSFKEVDRYTANSLENGTKIGYEQDSFDAFNRRMTETEQDIDLMDLDSKLSEITSTLDDMEQLGYLSKSEIDSIRQDPRLAEMDSDKQIFKFLEACLR